MKNSTHLLILMLVVILCSCSSQRKLARQFVSQQSQLHVLLLAPASVILKFYPGHPDSLAQEQADPFQLEKSQHIKFAEDSIIIKLFMNALRQNLEGFGINVYGEKELEKFNAIDSLSYVFVLAQLEVMEYILPDIKYTMLDTTIFEIGFQQVNLTHSQWFEFTEPGKPERPVQVLYSSQFTHDLIERGRFRLNALTRQMFYEYEAFPLRFEDLYRLSIFSGQKNAQYIFDFLLNKYIDDRIEKQSKPKVYLNYDRWSNQFRPASNDRFIPVDLPDVW